jgi:hypothetical protein
MQPLKAWRASRLRRRFMSEAAVRAEAIAEHRTPDATIDEVGLPGEDIGFTGSPMRSRTRNGYGTGNPSSPNWAGWSGHSGV